MSDALKGKRGRARMKAWFGELRKIGMEILDRNSELNMLVPRR